MGLRNYSDTSPGRRTAAKRYPTTPPPLGRDDIQQFDQRRRGVQRNWKEALASRQRGRSREALRFGQFQQRLGRDTAKQGMRERAEYGGRGLAFSPAGLGRAFTDIGEQQGDAIGEERASMADRLAVLNEEVNRARSQRDSEMSAVGADEARRRTDIGRLIQKIGL